MCCHTLVLTDECHFFISSGVKTTKKTQKTSVRMTTSRRVPVVKIKTSKRLWLAIEEHHRQCLKTLFREHYKSLPDGRPNRLWVTRLTPVVKHQLRLHFCVTRFSDLFDWTDKEIGIKILYFYHFIDYCN